MSCKRMQQLLTIYFVITTAAASLHGQTPVLAEPSAYTISTVIPDGILRSPTSVASFSGNLYVADEGNFVIRQFDASGIGQIVAGTARSNQKHPPTTVAKASRVPGVCYTQTGDHCLGTQAVFESPRDVQLDSHGNIFVSDISAGKIRRIDAKSGIVTTYAGGAGGGWSEGQLHSPSGMAFGPDGSLYVADKVNNIVRKIIPPVKPAKKATFVTIAGLGPDSPGCAQEGAVAATSPLNRPQDVAVDAQGTVYIADTGCRKIRMISSDGTISTLVGTGADHTGTPLEVPFTATKGVGTSINLAYPIGLAVDHAGNLLISDPGFNLVWLYKAKTQTVRILAGLPPNQSTLAVCSTATNQQGDGCAGTGAFLNVPGKPAIDSLGNIYIPEQGGTKTPMHPFDIRMLRPATK